MTTTFADLGVPDDLARALTKAGITAPFPIQAATIPDALAGRDLCGKAPTGSGKTIAFGIPLLARVKRAAPKRPKGLVLAPTRELALQVADQLKALSKDVRVLAVYGGAGIEPQIKALRAGVDIVVACPGRLLDLIERNCCDLRDVSFAVIDEADRMADMGFLPDVRRILDGTNAERQTLLFSATLDGAIDQLVKNYQHDPIVHEMADEQAGDITHHFWVSDRQGRSELVAQIVDRTGPTVVFCRTKHGSDRVAKQLANAGVSAAAIHGNRSQAQRERALNAFHHGDVQALVATDVAARGIHVEGVMAVVHFDIPADHKDYIHRSGRTGRAGTDGTVVTLLDKGQRKDVVKLKKGAGIEAEIGEPDVSSLPEGPQQAFRPAKARRPERSERSARPERSDRYRTERPAPARNDRTDRPRNDRPPRRDEDRPVRAERSERTRPERAERPRTEARTERPRTERPRTERPRPERTERARPEGRDRDDRAARARDRNERPSEGNRSERRQSQFTESERRAKAEANERAERGPDGPRHLGGVAGGDKVRPSGASRRKAKRASLVEAGLPVPAKKRRSGKPRPSASARRG